jgi:hypothetical protein
MNISECSGKKKRKNKGMHLLSLVTLTRSLNPTVVEPSKFFFENKTGCQLVQRFLVLNLVGRITV